jgi:hypothetical protein
VLLHPGYPHPSLSRLSHLPSLHWHQGTQKEVDQGFSAGIIWNNTEGGKV